MSKSVAPVERPQVPRPEFNLVKWLYELTWDGVAILGPFRVQAGSTPITLTTAVDGESLRIKFQNTVLINRETQETFTLDYLLCKTDGEIVIYHHRPFIKPSISTLTHKV